MFLEIFYILYLVVLILNIVSLFYSFKTDNIKMMLFNGIVLIVMLI